MPFACIFVPDFPVEALLRAEPELRAQGVAVLQGKPPLQKVFAVNESARRAGVEFGMTKLQVEACDGLTLRARSPSQEQSAHAALLDCAQSFSPRVEDTACDTIVLDVAGLEKLFGPVSKLARDIAQRASDLGLEANVAIAANPNTAVLAARGFSGVNVISEGREAEQLASLSVEALFADTQDPQEKEETVQFLETLSRWGIRNLHNLAALPEVALSERLGQRGVHLQQLARGAASCTLVPAEPPLIFEETVELDNPLVLLEPLAFLLNRLLEQICARLSVRALAIQELRLELELDYVGSGADGSADARVATGALARPGRAQARQIFHRTLRLPVPLLDPKIFLKLLQLDLQAHPPGAPITKIHLLAEPARPRAAQNGLFLPPSPEPEKLELTLSRIAGIVGENKVGSVQLLDTHRPQAFHMRRFAAESPDCVCENGFADRRNNHESLLHRGRAALQRRVAREESTPALASDAKQERESPVTALRIFRPPTRATVTLREGKPTHIRCVKQKEISGEILWRAGPWRFSGDWWEQEGWARDEWDIALQQEKGIALYRLVRDSLSGRWFVEGTYD
jgi:protein ImuB